MEKDEDVFSNEFLDSLKRKKEASKFLHTKEIRDFVFKLYGEKCLCCGSSVHLSIDHIIPVHKGGLDDLSNVQPLCKSCNSKKGRKIIDYRPKEFVG